jgi:hypothetical protein
LAAQALAAVNSTTDTASGAMKGTTASNSGILNEWIEVDWIKVDSDS